jgi:predicted metal-dependent hydrolase
MTIAADPRFIRGVALFNEREFLEASDCFEELFFEGVRDEPDFIRVFLQFSVGIHHAETGQWRPAVERIEEGVRVAESIRNDRGLDLRALTAAMRAAVRQIRARERPEWPQITSNP